MTDQKMILGMNIWQKHWKPRRYQIVSGLAAIADGLVRVLTLGWILPDWQLQYALYDTTRAMRLASEGVDEDNE